MKKLLLLFVMLCSVSVSFATCVDTIKPCCNPYIVVGTAITLSDHYAGGTWSVSNTSIATIGPTTGVLSPIAYGYVTVTHTQTVTCASSINYLVNNMNGPCIAIRKEGTAAGGIYNVLSAANQDYTIAFMGFNYSFQLGSDSTIAMYNIFDGRLILPPTIDTMFIWVDSNNKRVRNAQQLQAYFRSLY